VNIWNVTIGQLLGGMLTVVSLGVTTSYLWAVPEDPVQSQTPKVSQTPQALPQSEPFKPTAIEGPVVNTPRILKFTLTLSGPEDLKISQGDQVTVGQTIADRQQERQRLMSQLDLLKLSLKRINSQVVKEPPKPLPVPEVLPLPDVSYRQEEAELQRVSRLIDLQQQKLNLLQALGEGVPPATERHETLVMERLNQELTTAEANLKAAQEKREYEEYQHSLNVARRQEEENQQVLFYSNQRQEYEAQVRDREYQIAELQEKMANVEQKLEDLAIVTAPYNGTVRRIKWVGQTNNELQVEVTISTL